MRNGGIRLKYIKHAIAYLLTIIMLISLLPAAKATNGDSVIASISLSDAAKNISTTSFQPGSLRQITLYVPYGDSDSESFDLSKDIVLGYDQTAYKSVVRTPASNTISITKDTDNSYVKLTVTFNLCSESDSAVKSETVYYIRVIKLPKVASTFSGVIPENLNSDAEPLNLFSDIKGNYKQNEGKALDHIIVFGSNSSAGALTFPGSLTFEKEIPISELSGLIFTPAAGGKICYDITAYDTDNVKIGTAVLTIIVYSKPVITKAITDTVYIGSSKIFSAGNFTDSCDSSIGALTEVEVTPAVTTAGKWYVGGVENPAGQPIKISSSAISTLTFKGTAVGTATFTWNVKNGVGYADNEGSGTLTVQAATLTLSPYISSISILKGGTSYASASNFSYSPSEATLTFLKIVTIPAAADGYVCLTSGLAKNDTLGYPALIANTALKAGSIIPYSYLNNISIVSKSSSSAASISFTWSATADSTVKSAVWANAASYTVGFKVAGIFSYPTQKNVPVTLIASDFSTQYQSSTGYSLSYVTFTMPAATVGKLWLNYNLSTKTGTAATASTKYYPSANPNISNLTFVPYTNYSGTVPLVYNAYKSDGTYISGTAYVVISNDNGGTVSYTIDKNDWVRVDAADFSKPFQESTGKALSYVRFTLPSTSYGNLYYNYISSSNYESAVSSSTSYYVYSSSYLSYVSFSAANNYTGTVVISYTGYGVDGIGYSGKLIIFIVDSPAGIVSYTCKENGIAALNGSDFSSQFISVTGSVMSYVLLTPPAATVGVLYSDYSSQTKTGTKVTAAVKYRSDTTPNISNITFVPAKDYIGKVEIKYTVYSSAGTAYIGKLKISVGDTSAGTISLSTKLNTAVKFTGNEFSTAFYSNSGSSTLSYVTFSLPSTTYGVLYYNYSSSGSGTPVASDTKYYIGSSPYLSNISFVPQTGYAGSFTIAYMGYTADGSPYGGKILINVGGSDGSIYYSTAPDDNAAFSSADFVNAYYSVLGSNLSYVMFSSPSYSYGSLYYGYSSTSSYSNLVSSSTRYYPNASPYISNISFVPNSGYTGTFMISYTGYATNGAAYNGVIVVTVTARDGGTVSYKTKNNTPLALNSTDFNSAFQTKTGSSLYYVKFTLPSTVYGQLYYNYTSPTIYSSIVTADTRYYRAIAPLLSDVTFVPNSSYTGTVTITYTAGTATGVVYTGQLLITVSDPNAYPFDDVNENYYWAKDSIKYLYDNNIVQGSGDGLYYPGSDMTRGDFLLIVYRAFNLSATASDNFSDVPSGSYYYDAIAVAKALGITQGSDGRFHPDASISRQDAMVIITRTLQIIGNPLDDGSSGDLMEYSDVGDIATYATDAAAALVKAGIIKGSDGYLSPQKMISRAEMAVILYNVLAK